MEAEKERKNKMWNEMTDADRKLNQKRLFAYEVGEVGVDRTAGPGFELDPNIGKTDFRRGQKARGGLLTQSV